MLSDAKPRRRQPARSRLLKSERRCLNAILGILLIGCGGGGEGEGEPGTHVRSNLKPILLAPPDPRVAVGQEVVVTGQNFIEAGAGSHELIFRGVFEAEDGQSHPVDMSVAARRRDAISLSWRMWPDVVFHPGGDQIGRFVGEIRVANLAADGTKVLSDGMASELHIQPSIIPRLIRPNSAKCHSVVRTTIEGQEFQLQVDAIGLKAGSQGQPLQFRWTFMREHWELEQQNVHSADLQLLNGEGPFHLVAEVVQGRQSAIATQLAGACHGDTGSRSDGVQNTSNAATTPLHCAFRGTLLAGPRLLGLVEPKKLRTRPVPTKSNSYDTNIQIVAEDGDGKTAAIVIPLTVTKGSRTVRDGELDHIVRREAPQKMTGCYSAQDLPRDVRYNVNSSESRSRDMGYNINTSYGGNIGFVYSLRSDVAFGIDNRESVSLSQEVGTDISGQILPGEFGVFYSQWEEIERYARVLVNDECGNSQEVAQLVLTDWKAGVELATGPHCPPSTNFPKSGECVDRCSVEQQE